MRKRILDVFSFVPDKMMLGLQYRIKLGRRLHFRHPRRFTEKLQWYKVNYRDPLMHQCVDKFYVRGYVKSKGLEQTLIPLIGHYDSLEEVDWSQLPNQFVIKTTHGGGGLNVIICHDRATLSMNEIGKKIRVNAEAVKVNTMGREWAYYGLKPGIVIEELLVNDQCPEAGINDYKFFCFNGRAEFIVVDVDRYAEHKRNFYNREWRNLYITSDCPPIDHEFPKPENLDEMIAVAEKLSDKFPFVRVDLYSVGGKVYFGELTFYPWSGYVQFNPDEWDYRFGESFELKLSSAGDLHE